MFRSVPFRSAWCGWTASYDALFPAHTRYVNTGQSHVQCCLLLSNVCGADVSLEMLRWSGEFWVKYSGQAFCVFVSLHYLYAAVSLTIHKYRVHFTFVINVIK